VVNRRFLRFLKFWLRAWLGIVLAGVFFGILFVPKGGLESGPMAAASIGLMVVSTIAVLTWAFGLTKFSVLTAVAAGVITGILEMNPFFDCHLVIHSNWDVPLAGFMGGVGGGLFTALHWLQRDESPDSAGTPRPEWQFSLADLLVRFTIVTLLIAYWTGIVKAHRAGERQRREAIADRQEANIDWQFHVSTSPVTLSEAQETFTQNTGLPWPRDVRDVTFAENRVPLLGDGLFYVVFTVPPSLIDHWVLSEPPWGSPEWQRGPIPPEIGWNCGFGFTAPTVRQATPNGPQEYSGGDPQILAILTSPDIWFAARDRGPANNPWHNGDLLILDPKTDVVRYCNWDM
jgi:hypothetical protein